MSKKCLNKALQLLTHRDHSCDELYRKLKNRNFTISEIQSAIAQCSRLGYLDDQRFADGYCRQLHRKGFGINRIRQKIRAKGICLEMIDLSISAYAHDDIQVAACKNALIHKTRYCGLEGISEQDWPKLQRFLYGRGFKHSIIRKVMEEA